MWLRWSKGSICGSSHRPRRGAAASLGFTHYPQKRKSWRLFPGQRTRPDRIVMLDGTGSLSFDVLSWLSAQRIPLVQINWQGEVITVLGGTPLAADARPLVEAQRAAANGETGLALSVVLVREGV
jgi:CRISPR-associated protein Cas1